MVDWVKRVENFDDNKLNGQAVKTAIVLQPAGAMVRTGVFVGVGGLLGIFASNKMQKKSQEKANTKLVGKAKDFPSGNVIVAVTDKSRVIIYQQSAMSGKPSKFLAEYSTADFKAVKVEKRKLAHLLTLEFNDGGLLAFDAPRGQDLEAFAESIPQ